MTDEIAELEARIAEINEQLADPELLTEDERADLARGIWDDWQRAIPVFYQYGLLATAEVERRLVEMAGPRLAAEMIEDCRESGTRHTFHENLITLLALLIQGVGRPAFRTFIQDRALHAECDGPCSKMAAALS